MDDVERSSERLHQLHDLGVCLIVDDFGTGYSSLSYLSRFPVDLLKVDRSFVRGLGLDPTDTAIVRAVVTLAHNLGLRAVGEGVERTEHLDALRALGCDLAQGFLLGRPQPGHAIGELLDTGRHSPLRGQPPDLGGSRSSQDSAESPLPLFSDRPSAGRRPRLGAATDRPPVAGDARTEDHLEAILAASHRPGDHRRPRRPAALRQPRAMTFFGIDDDTADGRVGPAPRWAVERYQNEIQPALRAHGPVEGELALTRAASEVPAGLRASSPTGTTTAASTGSRPSAATCPTAGASRRPASSTRPPTTS